MIYCRLLVVGLILCLGCGQESGRVPISGEVTVDGRPLYGDISFRPREGTEGTVVMTQVQRGEYGFSNRTGPLTGDYDVVIELGVSGQKGAQSIPVEPKAWTFQKTINATDVELNFELSELEPSSK